MENSLYLEKNTRKIELLLNKDNDTINSKLSCDFPKNKVKSRYTHSFLNNLFFYWTIKPLEISNKKSLKIHNLTELDKNDYIHSMYNKLYEKWYNNNTNKNKKRISPKNKENSIDKNSNSKTKGFCPLFTCILFSNISLLLVVIFFSSILSSMNLFQIYLQRKLIYLFKVKRQYYLYRYDVNINKNNSLFFSLFNSIKAVSIIFLLNKFLKIFVTHHTTYLSQVLGIKNGVMLLSILLEKTISTAGFLKNEISEGQIINFITSDIETLGFLFFYGPLTVTVPFQFGIYLYLLFKFFGSTFIFGFFIFLILFIIAWIIQTSYIENKRNLCFAKDKRIKMTTEALNMIKVLKLYSWEEGFIKKIINERKKELSIMKKTENVTVLSGFVHNSIPLFLSLSSIGIYTLFRGKMPLEDLLAATEIFDSITVTLIRLPIFITFLLNCLISMKRIENFLNERDIEQSSKQILNDYSYENIHIKFQNCSFGIIGPKNSPTNNRILLNNINLEIKKGEFVVIIGDTGSGKSCLAAAILNCLDYLSNNNNTNNTSNNLNNISTSKKNDDKSINVINGTISYASQNPFIMNESIRNNIIFYEEFNDKRYNEILDICQLIPDLQYLPGGEFTEISANGTNISGGQKARISLARSIYKNADIYLFDDPLSSVDSIISIKIFNNVLLKFLKGKTRILIKNNIKDLDFADKIIYMDKGKVIFTGTYKEFSHNSLYKSMEEYSNKLSYDILNKTHCPLVFEKKSSKKLTHLEYFTNDEENERKKIKGKLIKEEEIKEGKISLKLYFKFIKSMNGCKMFLTLVLLAILVQITKVGGNIWLVYWSYKKTENLFSFLFYSQIGLFNLFFVFLEEFLFRRAYLISSKGLYEKMLNKIFYAPINLFHDITPSGQCINRLTSDLDKCKILFKVMSFIFLSTTDLLGSIYVCAKFNFYSLLSAPIMIFFSWLVTKFYINGGRDLNRLEGFSRTPLISCFTEAINGSITIKAYQIKNEIKEKFFKHLNNYYITNKFKFGATGWHSMSIDFVSYIYSFLIVVFACLFQNKFSPQSIGLLLKYSLIFCSQMLVNFIQISNIEKDMVSFERCDSYTTLIQEKKRFMNGDCSSLMKKWPSKGEIKFINFSARYRPNTEIVLKKINIHIKPGEKIGIVGRSGSGKSTITLAAFRIIESLEGQILIDDVDISIVGLKKLRSSLCIVPQEPTLFEGTLRENIDPFNQYKDNEIIQVLEELEFFDFMKNPKNLINKVNINRGLKMRIKECGSNLSLGERQLICFARAILQNSKIIFLDEATASLDQKTEDIIQKVIDKHFAQSTVLAIAHRVQTVKKCDRILVMDKGEIAEFDKPDVLLKNPNGIFTRLYTESLH